MHNIEFIIDQLKTKNPDPKKMQISLSGFLNGKNARIFMGELWKLLDSAQKTTSGIPQEFIDKKKEEMKSKPHDGLNLFEKEKVKHKDELKRRNDAIRALRKELTDANELIDTLKNGGLTEEGIAAPASKLIKSGVSFTQVYTQLVTCQEELLKAQKQAEDAEEKSVKLSEAVTELQGLLKQASDRYGSLEDHFEKEKMEHKEELKRRNNAIKALEYDLVLANKMLEGWNLLQEGVRRLFYCAQVRKF